MRKLVYAINLTLDGCCDHTKQSGSEELLEYYSDVLRGSDLLVYGRKTYQIMVPYWPDIAQNQNETEAENEFARLFDSIDKVVFSQSLDSAEGNTRIIRTNLKDEILKLKQQPGKDILVGGVSLPSQMIQLGLVNEFLIEIGPVLVGEGRRLMEDVRLPEKVQLKLVDSKIFKSGRIALHYVKQ